MEKEGNVLDRAFSERLAEEHEDVHFRLRKARRKLPLGYRATHNYDGSKSYILHFYLGFAVVAVVALAWLCFPAFYVGNTGYHLENGVSYSCPGGDWSGNTSQMTMVPGELRMYYYCPVDGRLIGSRMYGEALPMELNSFLFSSFEVD